MEEDEPQPCDCGWFKTVEPSRLAVGMHESFLALEGRFGLSGVRNLAQTLELALDRQVGPDEVGTLSELAWSHQADFEDPSGAQDLAAVLDRLLDAKNPQP